MAHGAKDNGRLPRNNDGSGKVNANLFCAGHAFREDGKLLVAGGHLTDGLGLDQACVYDPIDNEWEAVPALKSTDPVKNGQVMGKGHWYPTVISHPRGTALVAAGNFEEGNKSVPNVSTQLWSATGITAINTEPDEPFDLYPRMHVAYSGIIHAVSLADFLFLDQDISPKWQTITTPRNDGSQPLRGARDYACSVMYEKD
jgi:hypothetical protein